MRLAVFLAFLVSFLGNVTALMGFGPDWWWIPLFLLGWYIADAESGIIHFWLDYRPCRPTLGLNALFHYAGRRDSQEFLDLKTATLATLSAFERMVFDFKNHHPRPNALGRRPFLVLVMPTMVLALPSSLAVNGLLLLGWMAEWALVILIALILGGTIAQYHHGVLHRTKCAWWIRGLRRCRMLMTVADHEVHHASLDRDFTTLCGWSNPLVNALFRIGRRWRLLDPAGLEPAS